MKRVLAYIFIACSLSILLPGCAPAAPAVAPTAVAPQDVEQPVHTPVLPTPPLEVELIPLTPAATPQLPVIVEEPMSPIPTPAAETSQQHIAYAIQDLAQRLEIEADQIQLVAYELVIWPDGSLGCPQPGMAYTQALEDGYLIRLQVEQRIFQYHGGRSDRPPFLCLHPASPLGQASPMPRLEVE